VRTTLRALCCASLIAIASPAFANEDCSGFTKATIAQVMDVFHNTASSEQQKRQALGAIFQRAVDTDWIGKYVLGRYWRSATPEQQQAYLPLYRSYITNNYVSKFKDEDGFSVDAITVGTVAPAAAGGFEAKTLIQRKGEEDVHVDYLLENTGGQCHVHDIKVEGVSLLVSQRSEFGSLAGNGGIETIIAALKKKVE
jgi:phospholipid transport system substrate-binding protein